MSGGLLSTSRSASSKSMSSGISWGAAVAGFASGQWISIVSPARGACVALTDLPFTQMSPCSMSRWIAPRERVGKCERKKVSSRSCGSDSSTRKTVSLGEGITLEGAESSRLWIFCIGLPTAERPPKQRTGHENKNAQHLRRRGVPAKIIRRVIAAERFHERPQHRVTEQIQREDLSVKSLSAKEPCEAQ